MDLEAMADTYRRDGYVYVPDALTPDQREALRADFAGWVAESRQHGEPYGETVDGRAHPFDDRLVCAEVAATLVADRSAGVG